MCNELVTPGNSEQSSYHQAGDSVAVAKVMLMELESLVGNLYLAKEVIAKAGSDVHSAFRE